MLSEIVHQKRKNEGGKGSTMDVLDVSLPKLL